MPVTNIFNQQLKKLDIYCQYVGDTFILYDNRTDIRKLLNVFNYLHEINKLTIKSEGKQTLQFSDVWSFENSR